MADTCPHLVIPASRGVRDTVTIDNHEISLEGKSHAATVKDPGLAREINARYGRNGELLPGQVLAIPLRNSHMSDGHKTSFTVPALPWKDKQDVDE